VDARGSVGGSLREPGGGGVGAGSGHGDSAVGVDTGAVGRDSDGCHDGGGVGSLAGVDGGRQRDGGVAGSRGGGTVSGAVAGLGGGAGDGDAAGLNHGG
jgi:hypothetical protein